MTGRMDDRLAAEWAEVMTRYHRTACVLDRELLARHEISASEFELLQHLHDAGKACSARMHDLAETVHLSQSALSRIVTRLERDGLVERTTCSDDRRAQFVQLTAAGRQRYRKARPTQRAILRDQSLPVDA